MEKATIYPSRAKLKIVQLKPWIKPAWLGLITNTQLLISTYKHFYILVCEMTANPGLTSIVGPLSHSAANHVQNMANQMNVPHIETRYDS